MNIKIIFFINFLLFSLNTIANEKSIVRGSIVFKTYCVLCHGANGDGKGRLAVGKIPPPANLNKTMLTDEQKENIIRNGGESVGRSPFMPPWGSELSNEQIKDLISYINKISNTKK